MKKGPGRPGPFFVWLALRALFDLSEKRLGERLEVVGLARGDDVAVFDELLVDPVGTGVDQVGLDRGPRGHGLAPEQIGLREHPPRMADCSYRLVGIGGLL